MNSQETGTKISRITFNDINNGGRHKGVRETYTQIKNKYFNPDLQARMVYNSQYGFYIDEDNGRLIETEDGYLSYTFPIYKAGEENEKIENIIFSSKPDGYFAVFLAKYDITHEELKQLTPQQLLDKDVKVYYLGSLQNTTDGNPELICVDFGSMLDDDHELGIVSGTFYGDEVPAKFTICAWSSGGGGPASGGNGGTTGPGSGSNGSSPGGGSGSDIKTVIIPQSPIDIENCVELAKLKDPEGVDILPLVGQLINTLNYTGEMGMAVKKNAAGDYQTLLLPPTVEDKIDVPVGPTIVLAIHRHPNNTLQMFGWNDVWTLYKLYSRTALANKTEVTFMLLSNTNGPNKYLYALKVKNIAGLLAKLDDDYNNPIYENLSPAERFKEIEIAMEEIYFADNNMERVFLNRFKDYSVSLYKAPVTLGQNNTPAQIGNWAKLELEDPAHPKTSNVKPIPCN